MNLSGWELVLIFGVILLLFGGAKLPKLARSLGQAQKEFKDGLAEGSKGTSSEAEAARKDPPPADAS